MPAAKKKTTRKKPQTLAARVDTLERDIRLVNLSIHNAIETQIAKRWAELKLPVKPPPIAPSSPTDEIARLRRVLLRIETICSGATGGPVEEIMEIAQEALTWKPAP